MGAEAAWGQASHGVRFDWGPIGAELFAAGSAALVVVDVLSFSTSVCVAVERGTAVYPAPWRDGRAADLAERVGAVLAVGRTEVTEERPWSLSPAALATAPAPRRLVLPSPNGSAIAAAASGTLVIAGCLRNASAVGAWLSSRFGTRDAPVSVIAAGERWPDGSLRPAVEDMLGAGAVIDAMDRCREGGPGLDFSPEAGAAAALFRGTSSPEALIRGCASGIELESLGFAADVDLASAVDQSLRVPTMVDGAFSDPVRRPRLRPTVQHGPRDATGKGMT